MSTVLVTGAAGQVGRRLTAILARSPWVDRVLAVDLAGLPSAGAKVEAHSFDLSQCSACDELAALAKRADSIVHLAWLPEGGQNLAATRNVLDAAQSIGPALLVYLSSATVYGAWADNPVPITEDVEPRPNPGLLYAVEKRSAELVVEDWSKQNPGTDVAVLRPACTVGAPGRPLYEALAAGRRPPLGSEGRLVQYLHVDDLTSAVDHVVRRALSGTYNVAPDGGVREEVAGALAGGSATVPLPRSVRARANALRWELGRRGTPPGARAYAEHSWVVAPDKLKLTGWEPKYSSEEALVVSDARGHWDELSQSRRVSVTLTAATAALVAAGAGGAALWRRRR